MGSFGLPNIFPGGGAPALPTPPWFNGKALANTLNPGTEGQPTAPVKAVAGAAGVPDPGATPGGGGGSAWDAGMPKITDAQGNLLPQYVDNPSMATIPGQNRGPLDHLEAFASSTGPSPWLANANANVDQQTQAMRDAAKVDASSNIAGGDLNAATHGGLTGGGAARIAGAAQTGQAAAEQNAAGQGAFQKNANTVQDWQNKLAVSEGLPAQELASTGQTLQGNEFNAGQTNAGKAMNVNTALGGFGQAMNAFIGGKIGDATAASGKKFG